MGVERYDREAFKSLAGRIRDSLQTILKYDSVVMLRAENCGVEPLWPEMQFGDDTVTAAFPTDKVRWFASKRLATELYLHDARVLLDKGPGRYGPNIADKNCVYLAKADLQPDQEAAGVAFTLAVEGKWLSLIVAYSTRYKISMRKLEKATREITQLVTEFVFSD